MSFRSVVNGECFEEASFNNTLSDSFQEPAVSNMSVAMVTAACLCSASHICVLHGPPSFYRWRGLKNILHWEQLQLWPSAMETAPTALHSAGPVGNRAPEGVFTHHKKEGKKAVRLKAVRKCPSRPHWAAAPDASNTAPHLVTEEFASESVTGVEETLPVPPLSVHFSRGGGLAGGGGV